MRAIIAFLFCLISFHSFAENSLVGKINGKDWTFRSGIAKETGTPGKVQLTFWNTSESNPCAFTDGSMRQVRTTIAKEVGTYTVKDGQKIILDAYDAEYAAKKGKIIIAKIEDGIIYGSVDIKYDSDNEVKGDFEIPLCAANFQSCVKFDGRWQNSSVVYYLEHEKRDCSSVEFYKKRILPPDGEARVSFIADGEVHENVLSEGPYTAKLDMNGLTIKTNLSTYRYVIARGYCDGQKSTGRTLLYLTLDPATEKVKACYLVGFEM